MRKLFIILILCLSSVATYAADENITADSTVDGNITNNWWNVEVKWDHTLQQWDINAKAWDNIVVDNDDCLKYPDKCKKDITPTWSVDNNTTTPSLDSSNGLAWNSAVSPTSSTATPTDGSMSVLPKTWPAENVLVLIALIWGTLFVFRKKLFNI